jgi:uncharacterized protein YfdQ (DUF2303 family)
MMDAEALDALLQVGAASAGIQIKDGVRPHWLKPNHYEIVPAKNEDLEKPWRLQQTVTVYEPKSFVEYFTDYCNQESRIFADLQAPAVVGVIDYHKAGTEPVADWAQHRVMYRFRHTKEWDTWTSKNRQSMKQIEFARFIEDNLPDIIYPEHAVMLEISRSMEAKKNVNFSSGVRLQNGEIQFVYQEEIRGTAASGTIEVPELFRINIAPFEGSDLYMLDVRFRYTIQENALNLRYELVRPHKVIDRAVNQVIETIRQGVTNPITFGTI